jgi:chromosome segregation ATPase
MPALFEQPGGGMALGAPRRHEYTIYGNIAVMNSEQIGSLIIAVTAILGGAALLIKYANGFIAELRSELAVTREDLILAKKELSAQHKESDERQAKELNEEREARKQLAEQQKQLAEQINVLTGKHSEAVTTNTQLRQENYEAYRLVGERDVQIKQLTDERNKLIDLITEKDKISEEERAGHANQIAVLNDRIAALEALQKQEIADVMEGKETAVKAAVEQPAPVAPSPTGGESAEKIDAAK